MAKRRREIFKGHRLIGGMFPRWVKVKALPRIKRETLVDRVVKMMAAPGLGPPARRHEVVLLRQTHPPGRVAGCTCVYCG